MSPLSWQQKKDLADTLLKSRPLRRRFLMALLLSICTALLLGVWPLATWLESSIWLFASYWLTCGVLTLFMALLALYDMAAVPREEKRRLDSATQDSNEDSRTK